jgi:hypothetical protein
MKKQGEFADREYYDHIGLEELAATDNSTERPHVGTRPWYIRTLGVIVLLCLSIGRSPRLDAWVISSLS